MSLCLTLAFGSLVLVVIAVLLIYRLTAAPVPWPAPVRTMAVLGSGGHTAEMEKLVRSLDWKYSPVVLVVAADDTLSLTKARNWFPADRRPVIEEIRRSRKVGQSYVTSVWTTGVALMDAMLLIVRTDPQLVICNGPGTCVPVCIAAKLWSRSTVVFVESFCRVRSLSLTGRILYHIADHFLVQWPTLAVKYPKARYSGFLI